MPLISNFKVLHDQDFPVHSILQVTFTVPTNKKFINKNWMPNSITEYFEKHVDQLAACTNEDQQRSAIAKAEKTRFHMNLRDAFDRQAETLQQYLDVNDTSTFWAMWNDIIEGTFANTFRLSTEDRDRHQGRGKINIRKVPTAAPVIDTEMQEDAVFEPGILRELHRLRRQRNRCMQWLARLNVMRNPDKLDQQKLDTLRKLNREAANLLERDTDYASEDEDIFASQIPAIDGTHPKHTVQMRIFVERIGKRIDVLELQAKRHKQDVRKDAFAHDTYHKKAYKFLSNTFTAPILFLKRVVVGPAGQIIGTLATEHNELDEIVKTAWGSIYFGTKKDFNNLVPEFLKKYAKLFIRQAEFNIKPVDPDLFMKSCQEASNSAPGMDGWEPRDFKLLNITAFYWLASLLNCIEAGAPWPQDLANGRLAFLAKDPTQAEDPLEYRPLLVLPHLYRRWAAYRLQTLEPWVLSWSNDYMFAGVPGQGADDAWWCTSVQMEHWHLRHVHFSGSSADIAKCFDMIVRPVLYCTGRLAGMPTRILEPYIRYMEALQVRNTIHGGLGKPYAKRCGIPQGCPMSMMFIALLLRPWTVAIANMRAIPRILADDLMVLTHGTKHCENMQRALNFTHEFLHDMGAVVAPKKSFIFSNVLACRKWYAKHTWINLDAKIPVVKTVRDLGGTINTGNRQASSIIDNRIAKAISSVRKMRFLPHSLEDKATLIQTKIIPMALYGIEVAEPSAHMMQKLQSAIIDTLGAHSARRCNALVFELRNFKQDLDPHLHQATRRAVLFRRMWAKHQQMQPVIDYVLQAYIAMGIGGSISFDPEAPELPSFPLGPAPPPGKPGRAKWRPNIPMHGPISLLLYSVHQLAASIDQHRVLHYEHSSIDLINTPYQQLRPMIMQVAADARMAAAIDTRSDLHQGFKLDRRVLSEALKNRDKEDRRILDHFLSLSSWDNQKLVECGQRETSKCEFCDEPIQTTHHLLHCCPGLKGARDISLSAIRNCDINDLPKAMQSGLPPVLACTTEGPFWAESWHGMAKPTTATGCFNCGRETRKEVSETISKHQKMGQSASQLVSMLRGIFTFTSTPLPAPCCGRAPPSYPNVFSDGGVSEPTRPEWSISSFGVFWPDRYCALFNQIEFAYAHTSSDDSSASLWGPITGQSCSSTRAELVAAIVALCGDGPVHIATDSNAFLMRARYYKFRILLHRAYPGSIRVPIWQATADGDLWAIFWELVNAKGPVSVTFSKVKGHATKADVQLGIASERDALCNGKADALATKGRQERDDSLSQLAEYFGRRQSDYITFVVAYHDFLLCMLKAISSARHAINHPFEVPGAKKPVPKVVVASSLQYPSCYETARISLVPISKHTVLNTSLFTRQILAVLTHRRWARAPEGKQGITWIELCVLYFKHGGSCENLGFHQRTLAQSRPSLRQTLLMFIRLTRGVITKFLDAPSQTFFKPSKVAWSRLQALGYTNHLPCISGIPLLSASEATSVAKHLVALRHSFTRQTSRLFEDNDLHLRPQRISYRGAVPEDWAPPPDDQPHFFRNLDQRTAEASFPGLEDTEEVDCTGFVVLCPRCHTEKPVEHHRMLRGNAWTSIRCNKCKISLVAPKWLCTCKAPWHTCDAHAKYGHASGLGNNAKQRRITPADASRGTNQYKGSGAMHNSIAAGSLRMRRYVEQGLINASLSSTAPPPKRVKVDRRLQRDTQEAIASLKRKREPQHSPPRQKLCVSETSLLMPSSGTVTPTTLTGSQSLQPRPFPRLMVATDSCTSTMRSRFRTPATNAAASLPKES